MRRIHPWQRNYQITTATYHPKTVVSVKNTPMIKVHVPTEQYGFIEVEVDEDIHNASFIYESLKRQLTNKDSQGLPHLEWNKVLDSYLTTGNLDSNDWEKMSTAQKWLCNEIKKSTKRINK